MIMRAESNLFAHPQEAFFPAAYLCFLMGFFLDDLSLGINKIESNGTIGVSVWSNLSLVSYKLVFLRHDAYFRGLIFLLPLANSY